jgi:hypothetical protein
MEWTLADLEGLDTMDVDYTDKEGVTTTYTYSAENRLVGVIADLRRAFGDDAGAPRIVETIPTRGYRLAVPVEWSDGEATTPAPVSHFVLESADHSYQLRQGVNIIGREADADVCVNSEWVSRVHARIEVVGDGAVLEDLGSTGQTITALSNANVQAKLTDLQIPHR